jgi:hypothetical protein
VIAARGRRHQQRDAGADLASFQHLRRHAQIGDLGAGAGSNVGNVNRHRLVIRDGGRIGRAVWSRDLRHQGTGIEAMLLGGLGVGVGLPVCDVARLGACRTNAD